MKLTVFAPTPDGGHPAYVAKFLAGIQNCCPELEIVWPTRTDFRDDIDVDSRIATPAVIARMQPKTELSNLRWIAERLIPTRRHDFGFLRWYGKQAGGELVLIEEIQRYTLPLFVALCRAKRAAVVVHLHNVRRHDYSENLLSKVDEKLTMWALSRADAVLVHGEQNRDKLAKIAPGVRPERVHAIAHGVATRIGTSPTPVPSTLTFAFLGVNRPNKGLPTLVSALRLSGLPARLIVAGTTNADFIEATASALGELPDVVWENRFLSDGELDTIIRGATAVVLPYENFEAQSGIANLAIENGVPLVTSDAGGLPDVVNTFNAGIAVPAGDPSSLARALVEISEPATNSRFRLNIFERRFTNTWDEVGCAVMDVLRSARQEERRA